MQQHHRAINDAHTSAPCAHRCVRCDAGVRNCALHAPPWAECTHRLRSMHALALPRTWWLGRRRSCCHGGCKRRRAAALRWDAACWPAWRRGADALRCCGFDEGCARRRWQQGTPPQLQFSKSRAKSNAQRAARTVFGRGTFCCSVTDFAHYAGLQSRLLFAFQASGQPDCFPEG